MKRVFGMLSVICMILALCACGKSDAGAQVSDIDGTTSSTTAENTTVGETGTTAATTAGTGAQTTAATIAQTTHVTTAKTQPTATTKATVCGVDVAHTYKDGVCTRCGAKDPQYVSLATLMAKSGGFQTKLVYENKLYGIGLILGTRPHVYVSVSDPLSSLSEEMQKSDSVKQRCVTYDGVAYYYVSSENTDLTVNVSGESVTVTDANGAALTFSPDGGNLKCTAVSGTIKGCDGVKVGTVLTYGEPKG